MKRVLISLIFLALLAGGVFVYWHGASSAAASFRTAPLARGDLLITISATGTVEPVEVVDVGAQVAGRIIAFGQDLRTPGQVIDYGSEVEEGTVLARIDDALYTAEVAQAGAALEQTKANVRKAEADLLQMKAKLLQAENNWKRAQELGPSRALSATEYESYQAAYEVGKATVAVGEATVLQVEKSVLQAEASLQRAQTNLSYSTIKSPVKGVIIDRRVNIGQTVVASLNAPSLFLIARDLKKMQVWVAVNEADIGHIRPGQAVTFTVDAYPDRTFRGQVGKVRLNASMTQNVVTYTVEINTDNSDGKLLPYLTANVKFEVARRPDVLLAPSAALRWTPKPEQIAPGAQPLTRDGRLASNSDEVASRVKGQPLEPVTPHAGTRPARGAETRPAGQSARGEARQEAHSATLWIQEGEFVRPLPVKLGLSDGANTEVEGEGVNEGLDVVVGENARGSADSTSNPFTPQFLGRGRRS